MRPWWRIGTDADACRVESTPSAYTRVSRSHRAPWHAVAAWSGHVGIDVERVEAWSDVQAAGVLTPEELARHRPGRTGHLSSVWSAKEALAKALGDAVAYDPRRLDSPHFWADGIAGAWRACRLAAPAGHVAWLVWRP